MLNRPKYNSMLVMLSALIVISCGGSSSDDGYSSPSNSAANGSGYGNTTTSGTTSTSGGYTSTSNDTGDSASTAAFTASTSWQLNAHPSQQVPRVDDQQTVIVSMELDETNKTIKASFTNSNIAGYSMAHLHKGEIGQNGAVLLNFVDDGYGTSSIDATSIDDDTLALIKNGGTYINIHTQMYSDGKFRAQITDDQTTTMFFTLNGDQEVPNNNSTASGDGYASYHEQNGLTVRITVRNLSNVTGVHIHQGAAGQNGDVVVMLVQDPDNAFGWQTDGAIAIDESTANELLNGGHYINVHTSDYPDGEIRGQLVNN